MKLSLTCAWMLMAFCVMPSHVHAGNPEYRCEQGTVENDAVAIAYPDVDVGRFSNPNDKICTFAIGGASPTGPASRSRQAPLQEMISRIGRGDVDQIIVRLTLARSAFDPDVDEFRDSINSLLSDSYRELEDCFSALLLFYEEGQPEPKFVIEREQVFLSLENSALSIVCSVLKPGEYDDLRSETPTLHLRVRSTGNVDDSLFVPQEAIRE